MPIDINNSVLYIDYLQKDLTEQGHTVLFLHTRPRAVHLHNLSQKINALKRVC